ncbi:MAG: hypothetical protein ACYDAM_02685 [Leptospirales bacterium]
MPQSHSERDRKRLEKLKTGGGKNVLLRLRREETAGLDFLTRYYDLNKGDLMAKLIIEENMRLATLIMSDPDVRARFIAMPPTE